MSKIPICNTVYTGMGNYDNMPSSNLMLVEKAVEAGLESVFYHSKDSIDTHALFRKPAGNA